jgi:hypothetical protein
MQAVNSKNILTNISIAPKDPATKYRVAFNFMFVLPLLICVYVGVNYAMKVEMQNVHVFGLITLGIFMSLVGLYLSHNTTIKEVMVEEGQGREAAPLNSGERGQSKNIKSGGES